MKKCNCCEKYIAFKKPIAIETGDVQLYYCSEKCAKKDDNVIVHINGEDKWIHSDDAFKCDWCDTYFASEDDVTYSCEHDANICNDCKDNYEPDCNCGDACCPCGGRKTYGF